MARRKRQPSRLLQIVQAITLADAMLLGGVTCVLVGVFLLVGVAWMTLCGGGILTYGGVLALRAENKP